MTVTRSDGARLADDAADGRSPARSAGTARPDRSPSASSSPSARGRRRSPCTATATPRATTSPSTCARPAASSTATSPRSSPTTASRVINSGGAFSPIAYPWGWPLLLSPFVHLWGYDYDRLKLVEVAAFCVWLVLVHGIVRRRAGRLLALAVTAVVATAPVLLAHTDQLLSEYPHAAVVAAFIWWIDRIKAGRPLIAADRAPARRRSACSARRPTTSAARASILVAVIAVVQVVELLLARRGGSRGAGAVADGGHAVRRRSSARSIGFQLLLPSMLMPDNGDSPKYVLDAHRRLHRCADPAARPRPAPGDRGADPRAGRRRDGRRLRAPAAARRPAGRPHRAQRGDGQHPLPDGRPVLLPGHCRGSCTSPPRPIVAGAGVVLRRPRPAAGRRSSPPCRCCSSSPCTSPCCPATSAPPGTSTRGDASRSGRPTRRSRPIFDAVAGAHRADATSSPTSGPAR